MDRQGGEHVARKVVEEALVRRSEGDAVGQPHEDERADGRDGGFVGFVGFVVVIITGVDVSVLSVVDGSSCGQWRPSQVGSTL